MTTILTVHSLANSYADRKLANPDIPEAQVNQMRRRIVYNFAVTGFNVTTIATVVAVAATFFIHSPLMLVFALLVYAARSDFKEELDFTAVPAGGQPDRIPNSAARTQALLQHFGLQGVNWHPIQAQFLGRVWMNWVPEPEAVRVAPPNPEPLRANGGADLPAPAGPIAPAPIPPAPIAPAPLQDAQVQGLADLRALYPGLQVGAGAVNYP